MLCVICAKKLKNGIDTYGEVGEEMCWTCWSGLFEDRVSRIDVEIKLDDKLKRIPVVILTTSQADEDIMKTYNLHANCYVNKPVDMEQFITVVKSVGDFWFSIVKLPPKYKN